MKYSSVSVISLLLMLSSLVSFSQEGIYSSGTEFWLAFLQNNETNPSDDLKIYISSDNAASGTVEIPGQSWSQTFFVNPGSSTVVSIPGNVGEVLGSQVIENKGIHITSNTSVSVFASNYELSTSDATRVFPMDMLGTHYVVASYSGSQNHESAFVIVSTEDNTSVEIVPSVATEAGDPAGSAFVINLQKGECYELKASGDGDLTGSSVKSTNSSGSCRPFAIFSGAGCAVVPEGCLAACDHLFEQNYPTKFWGTHYFLTPFAFDPDPNYNIAAPRYSYRVLASLNGTNVILDGVTTFTLNAGQYMEFNEETTSHVLLANQPVAVLQYMEGIACGGNGDPSMIVLDDALKKVNQIRFNTMNIGNTGLHYFNVVIDAATVGTVKLDGATIAVSSFQSFSSNSGQLWCSIEIDPGSHYLESNGTGFSGILYGISTQPGISASYATSLGSFVSTPPRVFEDSFCTNNTVTLSIDPSFVNPSWYNVNDMEVVLAQTSSIVINAPILNGIYEAQATDPVSGCLQSYYFTVSSPDPIQVNLSPGDVFLCDHQSVLLQANAFPLSEGYLYSWTPALGLSDPQSSSTVASPDLTTSYHVEVSTIDGCASGSGDILLSVNEGNISFFGLDQHDTYACLGENVPLHVHTETTVIADNFDPGISWGDWEDILGGIENATCGSISGNGLYFNGTYPREAITQPADFSSGGTIHFSLKVATGAAPCDNAEPGDNIVLAYSVNNGAWTNIQTFYESAFPDFNDVSVTIPVAAQSANTRIRWRQVGSYTNNQDNWVLDDVYIGVNADNNYSYSWSPSSSLTSTVLANTIASPLERTQYEVEMTDAISGCHYSDSVFVQLGEPFSLNVSNDTTLCDDQALMLHVWPDLAGNYNYVWTPALNAMEGGFGANPIVNPLTTSTFHVVVTSEYGCESEEDVTITIGHLPDFEITSSNDSICFGGNSHVVADINGNNEGLSFLWSGGGVIETPSAFETDVSPISDTEYYCTVVEISSGCESLDSILIDFTPAFTIQISPSDITSCVAVGTPIGGSSTFSEALIWVWFPSSFVNDESAQSTTLAENSSGDLILTGISAAGCTAADTIHISVNEEITDLGPDSGFCADESMTLNAGWPDTYTFLWNTGATTSEIEVNESGTFSVNVVSPDGCQSQDEIDLTAFQYPVVNLGQDTFLCKGSQIELYAGGPGQNYFWNTGETSGSIQVNHTGIYHVNVDNGYCYTSDEIGVQVYDLPVRPFNQDMSYCFGFDPDGFILDAGNTGSYYLWNNDSTARAISITESGEYSVYVVTEHYCSSTFEITVVEDCPIALFVPNSFTPDNDGINDVWQIYGENIVHFHLRLYSRTGELFYESYDINKPWLGQRRDDVFYVEGGVYPYIIVYQTTDEDGNLSEPQTVNGHVTMVR